MTSIGKGSDMATDEKPVEDDGLADWAEALLEQKSTETSANTPEPGGVCLLYTSRCV